MPPKETPKRAALRERLLNIAEKEVSEGGIVALRARDLATEAGCAVGAIYTVFGDLGDIAVAVNRRTMDQITDTMTKAVAGLDREPPEDVLISLAQAYVDYAQNEGPRWRTLFAVGLPQSDDMPGFFDALDPISALFASPMEKIHPAHTPRKLDRNARTLFAAIHGLVVLGQEPRISAIEKSDLNRAVTALVSATVDSGSHL